MTICLPCHRGQDAYLPASHSAPVLSGKVLPSQYRLLLHLKWLLQNNHRICTPSPPCGQLPDSLLWPSCHLLLSHHLCTSWPEQLSQTGHSLLILYGPSCLPDYPPCGLSRTVK